LKPRGTRRPRERVERDFIGVGGAERRSAFARRVVRETSADKALEGTAKKIRDNGKEASGLERGT
jgi:hypothetical protein